MGYDRGPRRGNDRFGGGKNFGGDRPPRQMHPAVCAECNKDCEVPFKPSGDRPVYCRECHQAKRNF